DLVGESADAGRTPGDGLVSGPCTRQQRLHGFVHGAPPLVLPPRGAGQGHGHATFVGAFLEPVDGLVPVVGDLLVTTGRGDADGADGYEGDEKSHRGTSGDSASYRARDAFTSAFGPVTGDHDGQMRQSEEDRKADERVELLDVAEGVVRCVVRVARYI